MHTKKNEPRNCRGRASRTKSVRKINYIFHEIVSSHIFKCIWLIVLWFVHRFHTDCKEMPDIPFNHNNSSNTNQKGEKKNEKLITKIHAIFPSVNPVQISISIEIHCIRVDIKKDFGMLVCVCVCVCVLFRHADFNKHWRMHGKFFNSKRFKTALHRLGRKRERERENVATFKMNIWIFQKIQMNISCTSVYKYWAKRGRIEIQKKRQHFNLNGMCYVARNVQIHTVIWRLARAAAKTYTIMQWMKKKNSDAQLKKIDEKLVFFETIEKEREREAEMDRKREILNSNWHCDIFAKNVWWIIIDGVLQWSVWSLRYALWMFWLFIQFPMLISINIYICERLSLSHASLHHCKFAYV